MRWARLRCLRCAWCHLILCGRSSIRGLRTTCRICIAHLLLLLLLPAHLMRGYLRLLLLFLKGGKLVRVWRGVVAVVVVQKMLLLVQGGGRGCCRRALPTQGVAVSLSKAALNVPKGAWVRCARWSLWLHHLLLLKLLLLESFESIHATCSIHSSIYKHRILRKNRDSLTE